LSQQVARELKFPYRPVMPDAIRTLQSYSFPGNVRELRNLIERAYILSGAPEIGSESFPVFARTEELVEPCCGGDWTENIPEVSDLRSFLNETERAVLERSLKASEGSQAEAARRLGLSRSDFGYKLSKHQLKSTKN